MEGSRDFLTLVLDSISEHIAVIDAQGFIQYVNKPWCEFGEENACDSGQLWQGVNYIDECKKAARMGDNFGISAVKGINEVIEQQVENFYFEYPYHSKNTKRWFMMRVSPFQLKEVRYFIISHQDVTERKLAEDEVKSQARLDGLTDIPNR